MRSYVGTLGKYHTHEKLGAGGNGEVWRADGPRGEVALKILKRERRAPADAGPRFAREVEALKLLAGIPGVLPLIDAPLDNADADRWYVMPLATLLRKQLGSDASLKDVCQAGAHLAAALERVHQRGISHRDIKPDNLYWYGDQWCLGDFGLADLPDANELTESGRKLGPAFYIAPEMLNHAGSADGKQADIYSLGKTIWVLATGQTYPMPGVHDPTFSGGAIATYRVDPRSALLDEMVRRMTLLDPSQRPLASVVAHELDLLAEEPRLQTPPDPDSSLRKLRAALVPHFTRQQDEARISALAKESEQQVRQAIDEIVERIQGQTQLEPEAWWSLPKYWGYRESMRGPGVEEEDTYGFSFEAGGKTHSWRLCIGLKYQLLSDGQLFLHLGYHLDRLMLGKEANYMGMPRAWEEKGNATVGTPSARDLVVRLIAGLEGNLPEVLNRFSELVEEASKR